MQLKASSGSMSRSVGTSFVKLWLSPYLPTRRPTTQGFEGSARCPHRCAAVGMRRNVQPSKSRIRELIRHLAARPYDSSSSHVGRFSHLRSALAHADAMCNDVVHLLTAS
eukprot:6200619-Pleurochrysis_carterae.AAC.1